MMVIAALLTSLSVSREWEHGTMEQLIATPVKSSELILGKLVPYFAVGMLDVLIAVMMGQFLFEVPLCGSVVLVFMVAGVFLVGALGMGMTISVLTRNQLVSTQMAMLLTYLPAFLLSGFMFPVSNMPAVIRAVTYIVPARYVIGILRAIYLKGLGFEVLAVEMGLLAVFGVLMTGLAVGRFRKRLD
jgi:ABC-2 type transport system permease protein